MNELSFPNKFRIMFYSEIIEGKERDFGKFMDFSSWTDVPPLKFCTINYSVAYYSPTRAILFVGIQLKSDEGIVSQRVDFKALKNPYISILLPQSDIFLKGPTTAEIFFQRLAPIGLYTMPILANISLESNYPFSPDFDKPISKEWIRKEKLNLTVEVIERAFQNYSLTFGILMGI